MSASAEIELAIGHLRGKRWSEAEAACVQILARERENAAAWQILARAAAQQGRHQEALSALRNLAQLVPSDAGVRAQLSNELLVVGDLPSAETEARRAISLDARSVPAHINLGVALHHQGRMAEAVQAYRSALALNSESALAHSNLSDALVHLDQLNEAAESARRAVEVDPTRVGFWMNLTSALMKLDRPQDALVAARRAVELEPADHRPHVNAGMALLALGNWSEGWAEFEHRREEFSTQLRTRRMWDGRPLQGRPILLHGEQGFGDTIQFIRYAPLLRERCGAGRIVLECRPPLVELMRTAAGVDEVIDTDAPTPPDVEEEVFVMSLPHRLGTTIADVPADVPYLRVNEQTVARLRPHVRDDGKLRVGLVWAGNPQHVDDRRRSCPVAALRPVTQRAAVQSYSLQRGPAAERDARAAKELGMIDLAARCEDFADLAAAISLLDVVVSVDTAPAHLAGALGMRGFVLLPFAAEWRWMQKRSDSPWYPTLELIRQTSHDDWAGVVAHLVGALDRLHSRR